MAVKMIQCLYFLQILSKNRLNQKLLVSFYRATIESVIIYCRGSYTHHRRSSDALCPLWRRLSLPYASEEPREPLGTDTSIHSVIISDYHSYLSYIKHAITEPNTKWRLNPSFLYTLYFSSLIHVDLEILLGMNDSPEISARSFPVPWETKKKHERGETEII